MKVSRQRYNRGLDDKLNIKTDLEGVGCEGVWWIQVAQERAQWREHRVAIRISHKPVHLKKPHDCTGCITSVGKN
jgi:hypothetical protein